MSEITKNTYNEIAAKYSDSKMLPFRVFLEKHTLLKLLGNIEDLDILDLACESGFYTRIFKHLGTAQTIGVDLSEEMINVARTIEFDSPLGIVYIEKDVAKLSKIGDFDIVHAAYLLNYAKTELQLKAFCKTIYQNLKPGGFFIGVNDNIMQDPHTYSLTKKYGFVKSSSAKKLEGDPIEYKFYKNNRENFSFNNYYLKPDTYEQTFLDTGFKSFSWKPLELSKEGQENFPDNYWDDFFKASPLIAMVAEK